MSSLTSLQGIAHPSSIVTVKTEEEFKELPTIKTSALDYLKCSEKAEKTTRIIFVRHGQSESNVNKSIAGRTLKTFLSKDGEIQAITMGEKLKLANVKIDTVFRSPTDRTRQTAELILKELEYSLSIVEDERLHEKDYGDFEGATEEIYAPIKLKEEIEIPQLETFDEKIGFKAHPSIESMQEVQLRVQAFVNEIHSNYLGKTILATTHNGVMKALFMIHAAQAFKKDVEYRSFDLGNCSLVLLEIDYENKIDVVATDGLKFRKK